MTQQPVGRGGCVGVHAELAGQLADRRERRARRKVAGRDRRFDAGGYGFRTRSGYAALYSHTK
jgi:hypothetical protein